MWDNSKGISQFQSPHWSWLRPLLQLFHSPTSLSTHCCFLPFKKNPSLLCSSLVQLLILRALPSKHHEYLHPSHSLLLEKPNPQNILGPLGLMKILDARKEGMFSKTCVERKHRTHGKIYRKHNEWTMNLHLLYFNKHRIGVPSEEW